MATLEAGTTQRKSFSRCLENRGPENSLTWNLQSPVGPQAPSPKQLMQVRMAHT